MIPALRAGLHDSEGDQAFVATAAEEELAIDGKANSDDGTNAGYLEASGEDTLAELHCGPLVSDALQAMNELLEREGIRASQLQRSNAQSMAGVCDPDQEQRAGI